MRATQRRKGAQDLRTAHDSSIIDRAGRERLPRRLHVLIDLKLIILCTAPTIVQWVAAHTFRKITHRRANSIL